jgi:hypothetical protein
MRKYHGIPELLEQFMEEQGAEEKRWVTVLEIRDRFGLTRYQCTSVSGFLRRLQYKPFVQFPYIVIKIDWASSSCISETRVHRYLVVRRHNTPAVLQNPAFSAYDTP